MIADWQTDKIYFSEKLKIKFYRTFSQIEKKLKKLGYNYSLLPKTNDVWARDYMPIQTSENRFLEFRYDPDYLQGNSDDKDTRELKSYPDIICQAIDLRTTKTELILDGGNIVKSEDAIILTDKVYWENKRHFTKKQLVETLHEAFEVEKVILIPWDEQCEFGHSDGMVRFINNDTVLLSGFYEQADTVFRNSLVKPLEKAKLNCEWLRCANQESESNIAYINYLHTKNVIIVPSMNRNEDNLAFERISAYFPEYLKKGKIAQIEMTEIVRQGGALNCISWTKKEEKNVLQQGV